MTDYIDIRLYIDTKKEKKNNSRVKAIKHNL